MKKSLCMLLMIIVLSLCFFGCSGNSVNSTPDVAPTETIAPATPTESKEPSPTEPPTATPTEGIKFSDCLERMEPVENGENIEGLTVIGILDGHKVYNVLFETYDARSLGSIGFPPVLTIVSKYLRNKPNLRGPFLPTNYLADEDYVYVAVVASPTEEALDSAIQEAHDRWIAEGGTEEDWRDEQKGGQVKKRVRSEASAEATKGFIDALYAEGCPIIDIIDYQSTYATTIISVAKMLELNARGGDTFSYVFYNESWPRWQKEHTDQWREWTH